MKLKAKTWKEQCQAVSYLQVLASFVFIYGIFMLVLCVLTEGGGHDISDTWGFSLIITLAGGAAIIGRKITAILFSIMSACIALSVIAPCLMTKPHPVILNSICIALLFCIPALLTYRGWDALK